MNNRFKRFYLLLVTIFFLILASSCVKGKIEGEFYNIEDAYEQKFLTRDDLLNIAYYYNGSKNINDSDFVPKEVSINELSKSVSNSIKRTHLKRIQEYVENGKIEKVHISHYFGKYGKCIVLTIYDEYIKIDPLIVPEYVIDGVKFLNFSNGSPAGVEVFIKK